MSFLKTINPNHHSDPFRYVFFLYVSLAFLLMLPSIGVAANIYIDPSAKYNGDGTAGTQAAYLNGKGAYNTWSSVTFNVSNDYYQKCGTTWNTTTQINIISKDATSENRMILGAYYIDGSEVIGVSGAKPILNQKPHDDYLLYIKDSDYLHIKDLDLRGGYNMIQIGHGGVSYLLIEDSVLGKGTYQYAIFSNAGQTGEDPNNYGVIRNCIFDSDIGTSGAVPLDEDLENGTLQDAIYLVNGHNYWEIYNNDFIDWPHAAVTLTGYAGYNNAIGAQNSYNKVYNNHVYRVATGSYDYCRAFAMLGDYSGHHNEFYNNLIEGTTRRSQFGGYRNKFYYNIIDTMTDAMGNNGAQGILIMGSDWNSTNMYAMENEIYNNIFFNTDNAAIMVGSNSTQPIQDNVIANNIIYNCGNNYTGGHIQALGTGLWINGSSSTLDNKYYNNNIFNNSDSDVVLYKLYGNRYNIDEFNSRNGINNNVIVSNIGSDPIFKNVENGDFRLQSGSPCIDSGKYIVSSRDFIGTVVPQGSNPDIGAYEKIAAALFPLPPKNFRLAHK